jgi:hypothetical protein
MSVGTVYGNIATFNTYYGNGSLGSLAYPNFIINDSGANLAAAVNPASGSYSSALTSGTPLLLQINLTSSSFSISGALYSNYAYVFSKIATAYTVTITGTIQTYGVALALPHLASNVVLYVSDSSANITSYLGTLQASISKISTITSTDGGAIVVAASQLSSYSGILAKLATLPLQVTGVAAGSIASTLSSYPAISSITVSDAAANINSSLTAIASYGYKIANITQTGTVSPISLSYAQYTSGLASKFSNFTANVQGATAPSVAALSADAKVSTFSVSDTGSNVGQFLNALQSASSKLSGITVVSGVISLSVAQLSSDAAALSKISGSYSLSVTGVTLANLASTLAHANVVSVAVSDTAANIASSVGSLQSNIGKIAGISISDSSTQIAANFSNLSTLANSVSNLAINLTDGNTLTISASQYASGNNLLNLLTSTYTLAITGASTLTASSFSSNSHVSTVSVADSPVSIASSIQSLISLGARLSTITEIGTAAPIALTANQYQSGIANKFGNFGAALSNISASSASVIYSDAKVASFSVTDNVNNIVGNFSALQTASGKISVIGFTDSGSVSLSLSSSQINAGYNFLGKIAGNYSIAVSDSGALSATAASAIRAHVSSFNVVDSSTNILANLDALESSLSGVGSITLTNPGATLSLSTAQFNSDYAVIGKISSVYNISLTDSTGLSSTAAASVAGTHLALGSYLDPSRYYTIAQITAYENANAHSENVLFNFNLSPIYINVLDTPQNLIYGYSSMNSYNRQPLIGFWDNEAGNTALPSYQRTYPALLNFLPKVADNSIADLSTWYSLWSSSGNHGSGVQDFHSTNLPTGTVYVVDNFYNLTNTYSYNPNAVYNYSYSQVSNVNSWLGSHAVYQISDQNISLTATQAIYLAKLSNIAALGSTQTLTITDSLSNLLTFIHASGSSTVLNLGPTLVASTASSVTVADAVSINQYANFFANSSLALSVIDSGSNIVSGLSALQSLGSKVTSICISDAGVPLNVSISQLTLNSAVFSKIISLPSLVVSDTGQNILANLDQIQSIGSPLSQIIQTDNQIIAIGINQFIADYGALLKLSNARISVSGTASSIAANMYYLEHLGALLVNITLTSGSTLQLTADQVSYDSATLALISSTHTITVDSSAPRVSLSGIAVSQISNVLTDPNVGSIAVVDQANAISQNWIGLNALGSSLSSISLSSATTPIAISVDQLNQGASLIAKIQGPYLLEIVDTAANIAQNFDQLNALGSHLSDIVLSDSNVNPLVLNVGQIINDATTVYKVGGGFTLDLIDTVQNILNNPAAWNLASYVFIQDTAANISAYLDQINVNANSIGRIILTDPSNAVSVDYSQIHETVLSSSGVIGGNPGITLTVENAPFSFLYNNYLPNPVSKINIRDDLSNLINSGISSQYVSKIGGITLTETIPTNVYTSQLMVNGVIDYLNKVTSDFGITLIGAVSSAVANALSAIPHLTNLTLFTSTSDVIGNLSNLQLLANKIGPLKIADGVTVTDPGSLTIELTYAQYANNLNLLNKLTHYGDGGSYHYVVSGVSASQAIYLLSSDSYVSKVSVSDSAANINSFLSTLTSFGSRVTSIASNDNTLPSITIAQMLAGFNSTFILSDTAANVAANLDVIRMNSYHLSSVNISDGGTMVMTANNYNLFKGGYFGFGFNSSHSIDSSYTVSLTQVNASYASGLASDPLVASMSVSSAASEIVANIDALHSASLLISSVTIIPRPLTTSIDVMQLTQTQFLAYQDVIGKLTNTGANIHVSSVAINNLGSMLGNGQITDVDILDSTSNVMSQMQSLQANLNKISTIQLSDNNGITLSYADLTSDQAVIGKIAGYWNGIQVTNVVIAHVNSLGLNSWNVSESVLDTAANISSNLALLTSLGSKVQAIALSDQSPITLSWNDYQANSQVISKLAGNYQIIISGPVSASFASYIANNPHITSVSIADSANMVSFNLNALQALGGKLSSIHLTDSNPLYIQAEQQITDAQALAKITGNYSINLQAESISSFVSTPSSNPVDIRDTSANIGVNLDVLQSFGSRISSITLADSVPIRLAASQLASDANTLAKINGYRSYTIADSTVNVVAALPSLLANLSNIQSISLSDPSGTFLWNTQQFNSYGQVVNKIASVSTGATTVSIVDSASALNNLHFLGGKYGLVITSFDSDIQEYGGNVAKVDLTNLVDATFNTKLVNGGVDTQIDVIASGTAHSILLHGQTPGQVQVAANFSSSINNITAVGLSPDGSTLLINFSSGATAAVPFSSGAGSITLAGSTYQTSNLKDMATAAGNAAPVYMDATGGNTGYLLPTKFTGPASLGLHWQLVSNTDNAVITGSSDSEFLKVASANSIGKAVNGNGGNDVIDGGVGSTFVTGGAGHNDTFFLDGRAPGVSWSTITDFKAGSDKATIWGFVKGVSSIDASFSNYNNEGAGGYQGLTLHFKNLLPDGQAAGSNPSLNSITLSGHTLAEFGASSLADLNNQINNGSNAHFIVGATNDSLGTHGYLQVV